MHAVQYSHLGLIEVRSHIIDVHAAGRLDRGCELPETEGAAVARCDCDFRHVLLMRREPQGRRLFRGKRADCYCFVVTFVDLRIAIIVDGIAELGIANVAPTVTVVAIVALACALREPDAVRAG